MKRDNFCPVCCFSSHFFIFTASWRTFAWWQQWNVVTAFACQKLHWIYGWTSCSHSLALCKCADALLSSPTHNARSLRQGRSPANWPPPNKSSPRWQIVQPSSVSRDMMWRVKRTEKRSARCLSLPFFFFLFLVTAAVSLWDAAGLIMSHIYHTAVR